MTDNRKTSRAPLQVELHCVVDGDVRVITAEDVSESGLKAIGLGEIPEGLDSVKLYLPIRRDGAAKPRLCFAMGKVVWQSGDEAGIEFTDPANETVREIIRYVNAIHHPDADLEGV